MRWTLFLIVVMLSVSVAQAQTETPTPTPSPTPTPEPYVYATLPPLAGQTSGQAARFDYTMTTGDVMIAVLLIILLLSVWSFFVVWMLEKR
jgi:hypothetical protein